MPSGTATTPPKKLTPKQASFVALYLVSLNASLAYKQAYQCSETVANKNGHRLLVNAGIQSAIQAAMSKRSERLEITQDMVLQRLWELATADPRELIEYRRTCCRSCYGIGFRYQRSQHEIDSEIAQSKERHDRERREAESRGVEWKLEWTPPEFAGGAGWDPRKRPNITCPHCFGEGVSHTFVNDTRGLSTSAARLYAGIKETKDGFEIKFRDQDGALIKVGEHLGMFKGGANVNLNVNWEDLTEQQLEHLANGGSVATLPR